MRDVLREYRRILRSDAHRAFMRRYRKAQAAGRWDYESFARWGSLAVEARPDGAKRILVVEKHGVTRWMISLGLVPQQTTVVAALGRIRRRVVEWLVSDVPKRAVVEYCGDLDPFGLDKFLDLSLQLLDHGVETRWVGINSLWLPTARSTGFITMRGEELRHAQLLEPLMAPVWGEAAADMLASRSKLELEGAINPAIQRSSHLKRVAALLAEPPTG